MQVIYILSPSCVFWIVLTMSMEIMVNSCLRVNPLPFDHYLEEQNANWETNQIDNYHSEVSSYMLEYFYKLFHLLINIILFFQCQNKAFLTDYTFILFFWFYASDVNIRKKKILVDLPSFFSVYRWRSWTLLWRILWGCSYGVPEVWWNCQFQGC